MSNIKVSIATTDTPVPTGATFGSLSVVVTDSAGVKATQSLTAAPYEATFTGIADGAGSVTATALDGTGATLGTAVTQAFTTAVTQTTFPQPGAITVTAA